MQNKRISLFLEKLFILNPKLAQKVIYAWLTVVKKDPDQKNFIDVVDTLNAVNGSDARKNIARVLNTLELSIFEKVITRLFKKEEDVNSFARAANLLPTLFRISGGDEYKNFVVGYFRYSDEEIDLLERDEDKLAESIRSRIDKLLSYFYEGVTDHMKVGFKAALTELEHRKKGNKKLDVREKMLGFVPLCFLYNHIVDEFCSENSSTSKAYNFFYKKVAPGFKKIFLKDGDSELQEKLFKTIQKLADSPVTQKEQDSDFYMTKTDLDSFNIAFDSARESFMKELVEDSNKAQTGDPSELEALSEMRKLSKKIATLEKQKELASTTDPQQLNKIFICSKPTEDAQEVMSRCEGRFAIYKLPKVAKDLEKEILSKEKDLASRLKPIYDFKDLVSKSPIVTAPVKPNRDTASAAIGHDEGQDSIVPKPKLVRKKSVSGRSRSNTVDPSALPKHYPAPAFLHKRTESTTPTVKEIQAATLPPPLTLTSQPK